MLNLLALVVAALVFGSQAADATISGVSATFGGGTVTLNSTGIEIVSGTSPSNYYRFSEGEYFRGYGNAATIRGVDEVQLEAGSGGLYYFTGSQFYAPNGSDLGTSGSPWGQIYNNGDYHWNSPPTTTSNDAPVVYSSGNTKMYVKTNGYNGTCSNPTSIVIDAGIVVGCS